MVFEYADNTGHYCDTDYALGQSSLCQIPEIAAALG